MSDERDKTVGMVIGDPLEQGTDMRIQWQQLVMTCAPFEANTYGSEHEKRGSTIFANFAPRVCASGCLAYGPRDKEQENTVMRRN